MAENDRSPHQSDLAESGEQANCDDDLVSRHGDPIDQGLVVGPATDPKATCNQAPAETANLAPAEVPDILGAISGLSDQLVRRLDLLQTTFDRELRAEATRERVVDRLHAELQDYKQDFLLKVQRPIFIDLIQLHDDIGKTIDAHATSYSEAGRPTDIARPLLEGIQTAIEDILYRQGVEPFSVSGTEFDPRKQRAISTQLTGDPTLNKTVAARLRKGFCSGDKLIRPEIVTVFTFRPDAVSGRE